MIGGASNDGEVGVGLAVGTSPLDVAGLVGDDLVAMAGPPVVDLREQCGGSRTVDSNYRTDHPAAHPEDEPFRIVGVAANDHAGPDIDTGVSHLTPRK